MLSLGRTVVLYPFFFAGNALDPQRLEKTLSKRAVQIAAALILLVFVLSVYRYGSNLYWVRPLLTGREPFSSLSMNEGNGWLFRLFLPGIFNIIYIRGSFDAGYNKGYCRPVNRCLGKI